MDTAKTVEEFTAEAQKTMEKTMETGVEKVTRSIEDMTAFGQQNVEAVVASSKRAAKAAEEMNAEITAYAKKSYEDGLAAAKEISASKSVTELFEKQTAYAKTAMEAFIAEATKLNGMAGTASKECFEPLNARMSAATELFKPEAA